MTEPEASHWSKDYLEHLRSIHFALMAVSAGLLMLASFTGETETTRAQEQVRAVTKFLDGWNSLFIQQFVQETAQDEKHKDDLGQHVLSVTAPDHTVMRFRPEYKPPQFYLDASEYPSELRLGAGMLLALGAPSKIGEFQKLWDSLAKPKHVYWPSGIKDCIASADFIYSPSRSQIRDYECAMVDESALGAMAMSLIPFKFDNEIQFDGQLRLPTHKKLSKLYIIVHVHTMRPYSTEFDAQPLLSRGNPAWHRGLFADVFRELAARTELKDADFQTADRVLSAERRREGDVFEALGLKIPARVATSWGVLLILAIQVYLWVHLREFNQRLGRDEKRDVAWVGVYGSIPARVLVICSVLLLPTAAVVVLSARGVFNTVGEWRTTAAFALAFWVNIILTLAIWKALPLRSPASIPNTDSPVMPGGGPEA